MSKAKPLCPRTLRSVARWLRRESLEYSKLAVKSHHNSVERTRMHEASITCNVLSRAASDKAKRIERKAKAK